jgi:hypothetical protein
MRTIQEIETHLKNYKNSKHLMDLKPKTPTENMAADLEKARLMGIATRHKVFFNKDGIKKQIDLTPVRKRKWRTSECA